MSGRREDGHIAINLDFLDKGTKPGSPKSSMEWGWSLREFARSSIRASCVDRYLWLAMAYGTDPLRVLGLFDLEAQNTID